MPALSGPLTYVRLFVEGELGGDFRERVLTSLREHAMKPLTADDDLAERSGWCALGAPEELELREERVFCQGFVNLGFRADRWVIPAARLRAAEAAHLAEHGRAALGKRERQRLRRDLLRELRRQSTPSVQVIDLSWSLDERVVRFFSQSQRSIAGACELFNKTFDLKLVPEAPFTLAARLGLSAEEEALWDALEPTRLGAPAEV